MYTIRPIKTLCHSKAPAFKSSPQFIYRITGFSDATEITGVDRPHPAKQRRFNVLTLNQRCCNTVVPSWQ